MEFQFSDEDLSFRRELREFIEAERIPAWEKTDRGSDDGRCSEQLAHGIRRGGFVPPLRGLFRVPGLASGLIPISSKILAVQAHLVKGEKYDQNTGDREEAPGGGRVPVARLTGWNEEA